MVVVGGFISLLCGLVMPLRRCAPADLPCVGTTVCLQRMRTGLGGCRLDGGGHDGCPRFETFLAGTTEATPPGVALELHTPGVSGSRRYPGPAPANDIRCP